MRVLVTGASGFIGLPVVQYLKQQGQNVLDLYHEAYLMSRRQDRLIG